MRIVKTKVSVIIATLLAVGVSSAPAFADKMVLNYDGFFDRIEKLDAPELVDVKLAFYLKELTTGKACSINSVVLKTKLKEKDVYFYDTGEIVLPYDKQLDLDKAKVVIDKDTLEPCGLDMRLESTQLFTTSVSSDTIHKLTIGFDAALKEQAGMMSFLTPDVTGVTFISDKPLSIINSGIGQCSENRCTINRIGEGETVLFNTAPTKAFPFIENTGS